MTQDIQSQPSKSRHAAQYVRVSTDHQKYALQNQILELRHYAESHDIEIVRTYSDEGISGLGFYKRAALRQLIQDVVSGDARYSIILVYDVSRWGRFQDTDESAHYEFICRQSGIQIEYCGEQFDNDGSPTSALIKNVKRLMAAEYSRDLSKKVFVGLRRTAEQGFHATGVAGFGLRRLIVGPDGVPKSIMEVGQQKSISLDRTILVPGPPEEVEIVRWIFEAYASGKSLGSISRRLRTSELPAAKRRKWDRGMLRRMLSNEIYIGNKVWNKSTQKLGTRRAFNPPSDWVHVDGVIEPIISRKLFERAQGAIPKLPPCLSDEQLLDGLRNLLSEKRRLTAKLINEDKCLPSAYVFEHRFGGLVRAYEKIGYSQKRNYWDTDSYRTLHELRVSNARTTAEKIWQAGQSATICPQRCSIIIRGDIRVFFMVIRCSKQKSGKKYWDLRPSLRSKIDILAIACMDCESNEVLDYYLIPRDKFQRAALRILEENHPSIDCYRSETLEPLCAMATYGKQSDMSLDDWIIKSIGFTQRH